LKVVSDQDDPFAPREGRDLLWSNISLTVKERSGKGEVHILKDVWGEVPKGHMTAIMGPSGSGKTSLLNVLSGRVRSTKKMKVSHDIRLENYQVDPNNINTRKSIAFVSQDDSLQVTATPREAIFFSAKLRLPRSTTIQALKNTTERILYELGLKDCADTIIGGALTKGISGGERKRTSVGIELVTRPALIFLDEPTSGLDSFNALQLCRVLRKVASSGSAVLFTIHQPSSEIFNSLDRLLLLNKGRVMYQGPVTNVVQYFGHRDHPVPPNYNPSDHIMQVAMSTPIKSLEAAGYFQSDNRQLSSPLSATTKETNNALGITRSAWPDTVGVIKQTQLLFHRELQNMFRSTNALSIRILISLAMSVMAGSLCYKIADSDFNNFVNVQTMFGSIILVLLSNMLPCALPSMLAMPEERPVFLREYTTNHYSVLAYFLSKLAIEALMAAFQVTLSCVILYFMIGFSINFRIFWSILYLASMLATAQAVMIGCAVENPTMAVEFFPLVFLPQLLFAGFFVPPHLMPFWLRWLHYVFPMTYLLRLLLLGEFDNDRPCFLCMTILDNTEADPNESWWYWSMLAILFVIFRLFALFILTAKAKKFY